MNVEDVELVEAGWKVITGGLRAFMASSRLADWCPTRPASSGSGSSWAGT